MGAVAFNPTIEDAGYLNIYSGLGTANRGNAYRRQDESLVAYNSKDNHVYTKSFFNKEGVRWVLANYNHSYDVVTYPSFSGFAEILERTTEYKLSEVDDNVYSLSDMLEAIKRVFGLSTTNIASIVGVSRATIYNHISSGTVGVAEYEKLFNLALKTESSGFSVSRGLKSVMIEGKTLIKHFSSKPLDEEEIFRMIETVSIKLEKIPTSQRPSVYEEKLAAITINK